jgi:beta-lactamase superfamily II metal-dependent hydrolase
MGIPIQAAQEGQILDLGDGASLNVLRVSGRGAVFLVQWGNFNVLLPIGMDFDAMESLQNDESLPPVTALLLADSGYKPVNTREWIEHWNPVLALLSVGSGDWRGLPDNETLIAVQGYNLLRTDINGWIDLSTDGNQLWIEVERR